MNAADAATLLMAVVGSELPKDAPEAVRRLRGLRPRLRYPWGSLIRMPPPEGDLVFMDNVRDFADAVERMIVHAPQVKAWAEANAAPDEISLIDISRYRDQGFAEGDRDTCPFPDPGTVFIKMHMPGTAAEIHFGRLGDRDCPMAHYHEYFLLENPAFPELAGQPPLDRKVSATVGVETLLH